MTTKPESYPAIYIIFTLLTTIRRGVERKNIWCEFRRQGVALQPRLSFWIAVCREAGLVKDDDGLHVTSYARSWLNKTPEEQAFHLIESWQNAPKNSCVRAFRKKLLWKLRYNKLLTAKDRKALHGLDAFGLTADGRLTKWGSFFIGHEGTLPTPQPFQPCSIQDNHLLAQLPAHVGLLWAIERFLRPISPGRYPLTKSALQFFEGDPNVLIELIERGLGSPIPGQTKAMILNQPSIRIAEGIMLEFSNPVELKQLRRQPAFRKYIDGFISPQRILVSKDKADGLFKMLKRRGIYVHRDEEQPEAGRRRRTHFPSQQKTTPAPVGKNVPKMTIIEKYKQLGQALDILYRTPGYPAEQRRITPLFVEERGEHTYIIAYCQTRRAQRTFRLDRIEVPGTW